MSSTGPGGGGGSGHRGQQHAADGLAARYERIAAQLAPLFAKQADPLARMASAAALLHHKMPHFSGPASTACWTAS